MSNSYNFNLKEGDKAKVVKVIAGADKNYLGKIGIVEEIYEVDEDNIYPYTLYFIEYDDHFWFSGEQLKKVGSPNIKKLIMKYTK